MPFTKTGKIRDEDAGELRDITAHFMIECQRLERLISRLPEADPVASKLCMLHSHVFIASADMHNLLQVRAREGKES